MAYNIVKHRRGTTAEWALYNLVPESGELVIEECLDGTCKCKIGNGRSTFSELPYITDGLKLELLEKIEKESKNSALAFKKDIAQATATTIENTTSAVEAVKNTFNEKLQELADETSQSISEVTATHLASEASLKNTIVSVEKDLSALYTNVNSLRDSYITTISGLRADIHTLEDANSTIYEQNAERDDLLSTLKNSLTVLDTNLQTFDAACTLKLSEINTAITESNSRIEFIQNELNKKESEINSATNTKLEDINNKLQRLQELTSVLATEIGRVKQGTQETIATINTELNTISTNQTKVSEEIDTKIAAINNTIQTVNLATTNLVLEQTANIYTELSVLEQENKKLTELVASVEACLTADIDNVNKSTTDRLTELESSLTTAIQDSENYLLARFNNKVSDLTALVNQKHIEILKQLDTFKIELTDELAIMDTAVQGVSSELAALRDDTDSRIRTLDASITVEKEVTDNKLTALKRSIDNTKETLLADIGSIDAAVKSFEAKSTIYETSTTNRISGLAATVKNNASLFDTKLLELQAEFAVFKELSNTSDTQFDTKLTAHIKDYYDGITALAETIKAARAFSEEASAENRSAIITLESLLCDVVNNFNTELQIVNAVITQNNAQLVDTITKTNQLLAKQSEDSNAKIHNLATKISEITAKADTNTTAFENSIDNVVSLVNNTYIDLQKKLTSIEAIVQLNREQATSESTDIRKVLDILSANHADDLANITNLVTTSKASLEASLQILSTDILNSVQQNISNTKSDLQAQINEKAATEATHFEVNSKNIKELSYKIDRHISESNLSVSRVTNDLAAYKTSNDLDIANNVKKEIVAIKNNITKTNKEVLDKFAAINAIMIQDRIANNKANTSLLNATSKLEDAVSALNTRIITQDRRISQISQLKDGSTTGDLELQDIRIGNTREYDSAGDAVRAIEESVATLRNSLSQYIDTQAIDGLYYDYAGETGIMQPYMLYLTAGGQVIDDSGVQIISGAGGGGGGNATASSLKIGYVTTSPVITTTNDNEVKLKFTFTGTDPSGDAILQAGATWKVNNTTVAYSTVTDGENEFDVTKYLGVGTTKVLLVVTDDNGSTVTKSWSIQQVELSVSSQFNEKSKYPANEELIFTYIPNGSVEKVAVFKLDGKPLDRVTLSSDISGTEVKYRIPPQSHGAHLLEFYLEADINGETILSNKESKDIIFYDSAMELPVIGVSEPIVNTKQYSTVNIIYTVYDPKFETPTVTIYVDDVAVSTATIKPNASYNNTPTGVYSYTETKVGVHEVKIVCGTQTKIVTVNVDDLGINIAPSTTGLVFDFNPVGYNNGDITNRLWSDNGVKLTVSDNFDWTNGGYIPNDPDGPCFCIKAGSAAYIDYQLFADDAKKYGKEFKLIFKTKNVANIDAIFLSCLDNTTDKDHIGIEMGVHAARIYGQSNNLELSYSEEDVIEFEFNISKNTEKVPMVMGYEDGVPSRPMVYDDTTYSFTQGTPKIISIGSPDCDVYIYRFKVYNTSLTDTEILNNFIADARTAEEMIARYNRNQIYDENHNLTPETLAEKCPWLRVYKVSAPHFTNNKSDKVSKTIIQQLYKNGDPILDNWTCYNAQHAGQGTSSNNYGAAGRNLDFIMNKSDSYIELSDGTVTDKITLTRTSVPVAYLNAKVNIASSNNLTNAILANKYNEFNPYRRPFVARENVNSDHIKDTMEFHNCVIFIQETDPDLTTHREFADTNWHFYAIGNIGDSKKTDATRATDPDDEYECCVEIMDVGLPLSDFPTDTMINAMGYTVDEKTGERNYQWAKNDNLDILYELIDGEYIKTTDQEVDLSKTYYVDILVNDDFSEDYTYGWRYISDDEDATIVDYCKQKWIEFYRFVTQSSDEDFKAHLSDYFVVDSALYYYLFTSRYCMVDNRAKNTFWHYSKTSDLDSEGQPIRKWDLCWDYDNDTSLGLNNYGKQVYRYGLEDIDRDETGEEVFRESDSTFFCRIRDLFASELMAMYKDLESKNAWHAESFLNTCDIWQNEFPEELWRIDIERKYLRTYTSSFINGKGDSQFLVNMCNGRMKYHRRQWERNQEQYMASKYQTVRASGDNYHANFRVNRFDSTDSLTVKPNYQLTLTPFSYIYLNVWYGDVSRTPYSVRAVPNQPISVPCPAALEADIINVGSAAAIRDFGDLSASYPKTVSIGNASRVKKLLLGNSTDGYNNAAFTTLTTDVNPLLEEINIENISSLSSTLNFSGLINLKKLFAYGTNLSGVTFAQGGKLEEAELPAINNITLKQLKYLSTAKFNLSSYDNVIDIVIEDCPLINKLEVFNKCNRLNRARILDIDFGNTTYEYFSSKVFHLKGLSASGEETPNAVLRGKVRFNSLTGAQFNDITSRYPELEVSYDYLISTVTFKDTDTETTLTTLNSENAADCSNPVYYGDQSSIPEGMIAKPIKNPSENGEFNYEFLGWSMDANVIVSIEDTTPLTDEMRRAFREDATKHVEGDRVLYPVFEAIRRSYEVTFINPTAPENSDKRVVLTISVPYGSNAVYSGIAPEKLDVKSPKLYGFIGWLPDPAAEDSVIRGEFSFEAQFAAKDQNLMDSTGDTSIDDGDVFPGYTIGWLDISNLVDRNGKVYNGYTVGYDSDLGIDTLNITECGNKYNTSIRIPEYLEKDNTRYHILNLNGFAQCNNMELVILPENLRSIQAGCFSNCYNLFDINIPDTVTSIGMNAFKGCASLSSISIPEATTSIGEAAFASCSSLHSITVAPNNPRYVFNKEYACLIDTNNLMLLHGTGAGSRPGGIPVDGTVQSLGEYCFASSGITNVWIPTSITTIPSNAFSRCEQLTSVTLPSTLKTLSATCFAWCYSLSEITLPEGLLNIGTFVFNSCPLKRIEIPSTILNIEDRSFANIPTLEEVVFKKPADGSISPPPKINDRAFEGSGTANKPIKFYWPEEWTEEPPAKLWNAVNASADNVIRY